MIALEKSFKPKPPFLFKKRFKGNMEHIFSNEKMIYSGNCISAPISYIFGRFSEYTICPNYINVLNNIFL